MGIFIAKDGNNITDMDRAANSAARDYLRTVPRKFGDYPAHLENPATVPDPTDFSELFKIHPTPTDADRATFIEAFKGVVQGLVWYNNEGF